MPKIVLNLRCQHTGMFSDFQVKANALKIIFLMSTNVLNVSVYRLRRNCFYALIHSCHAGDFFFAFGRSINMGFNSIVGLFWRGATLCGYPRWGLHDGWAGTGSAPKAAAVRTNPQKRRTVNPARTDKRTPAKLKTEPPAPKGRWSCYKSPKNK